MGVVLDHPFQTFTRVPAEVMAAFDAGQRRRGAWARLARHGNAVAESRRQHCQQADHDAGQDRQPAVGELDAGVVFHEIQCRGVEEPHVLGHQMPAHQRPRVVGHTGLRPSHQTAECDLEQDEGENLNGTDVSDKEEDDA